MKRTVGALVDDDDMTQSFGEIFRRRIWAGITQTVEVVYSPGIGFEKSAGDLSLAVAVATNTTAASSFSSARANHLLTCSEAQVDLV